jgi:ribosomal protein S18 acetylase RimI-like enzyme
MPQSDAITVRPARRADLEALGRLGASLARAHHAWDPARFFTVAGMDDGYAWWLGKELGNRQAVVLVALRRGRIVGYAYGRVEPRDWNALRDTCGVGIDLMVEPRARGLGAGHLLGEALMQALREKGAPRIVLYAAARNRDAQRYFKRQGFRPTMIEMTRELDDPPSPPRRRPRSRAATR